MSGRKRDEREENGPTSGVWRGGSGRPMAPTPAPFSVVVISLAWLLSAHSWLSESLLRAQPRRGDAAAMLENQSEPLIGQGTLHSPVASPCSGRRGREGDRAGGRERVHRGNKNNIFGRMTHKAEIE